MSESSLIELNIVTPSEHVLKTQANTVASPSVFGEFGVLPDAMPILVALKAGVVKYEIGDEKILAAVGPGFAEFSDNKMTILTDQYVEASAVDESAVQTDLDEALARLSSYSKIVVDAERGEIERDIEWAEARLALLEQAG